MSGCVLGEGSLDWVIDGPVICPDQVQPVITACEARVVEPGQNS
jgi:hypothetical protein